MQTEVVRRVIGRLLWIARILLLLVGVPLAPDYLLRFGDLVQSRPADTRIHCRLAGGHDAGSGARSRAASDPSGRRTGLDLHVTVIELLRFLVCTDPPDARRSSECPGPAAAQQSPRLQDPDDRFTGPDAVE